MSFKSSFTDPLSKLASLVSTGEYCGYLTMCWKRWHKHCQWNLIVQFGVYLPSFCKNAMLSHSISYLWILRHTDAPAALPLYLSGPRWIPEVHNTQIQGLRSILAAMFLCISADNGNPVPATLEQRRELGHTAAFLLVTASSALPKDTHGLCTHQDHRAGSEQPPPQRIAQLRWHKVNTGYEWQQDNLCFLSPNSSPAFNFCLAFLIILTHCPEQIQFPS